MKKSAKILIILSSVFLLLAMFYYTSKMAPLTSLIYNADYLFTLINKNNSVQRYRPGDLINLAELGQPNQYLRRLAYGDLKDMMESAKNDGLNLKIISAWRSYETQSGLFAYYSGIFGKMAQVFSARAGYSEHQLGTAVDFGSGAESDLTIFFALTAEGKWLEENAWKYGFALSYPLNKMAVTGYQYEPWHYRYIGKRAAREFKSLDLSLEEYLSKQPQFLVD